MIKGKYMEGIDKLEKSLINWKIRQGIESACHIKCENPNVEATSFPTHKFNFENDPEGRYFVHVMERTVCYKNCVAGNQNLNGPEVMNTFRTSVWSSHANSGTD